MDFVYNDAVPLVGLICSLLGQDHATVTSGTSTMTVSFDGNSSTINTASSRNRHTSPRKRKKHAINHLNGMRVASRSTNSGEKRNGDNVHSDLKREVSESVQQTGCDDDDGGCHDLDQETGGQSQGYNIRNEDSQRSKGVSSLASYLLRRKEQALRVQNNSEDDFNMNTRLQISKEGCSDSVCEKSNFRNDRSTQDGNKPLESSIGSGTFSNKTSVGDHTSSHIVKSSYKRRRNNHVRKTRKRDHFTIQFGEKLYKCFYCSEMFYESSKRSTHIRKDHIATQRFQCSFCDKTISGLGGLHLHERIHTGIRPHKCSICNKAFYRAGSLRDHIRTHTGEKPFKCSLCDKAFAVSCALRVHERVHSGEKPYMCSSCGKRFVAASALQAHMRTHTGEKPYKCIICGRAFSTSTHLHTHGKVHRKTTQALD